MPALLVLSGLLLPAAARAAQDPTPPAPPTISKSFTPSTINNDGVSTLTLTLGNPSGNATALTGVAVSDTLLSSGSVFQVDDPPDLVNGCGGTVTGATPGSTEIAISGVTLPPNESCSVSVQVTAPTGNYPNSTSPIVSENGGTGLSASATLSVGHPAIHKSFLPSSIPYGGISQLTITLINSTYSGLSGATFTDLFPEGLVVASPVGLSSDCGGAVYRTGSTSALAPGDSSLTLVGGSIPKRKGSENANIPERKKSANGSCSITLNVTASATAVNVIPAHPSANHLQVDGPDYNTIPAQATLLVYPVPTGTKSFTPASIGAGSPSRVTITLGNSNSFDATEVAFTDNYPSGLVNHATTAALSSCGGSLTALPGGNSLQLTGATIPARASCSVTVNVTSASVGTYTSPSFQVSTGNLGPATVAPALLTVLPPPNIIVLKTVQNHWDPVNGSANPRAIPGGEMLYQLLITNSGGGATDANSIVITDPIPLHTSLMLGATPVSFADGSPSSGLSFSWGGAASLTDDVQFSRDGGTDFDYVPSPGSNGADPAVTHIRITPRGAFNASDGSNNPNFGITFKVIIN
ncbi:MAG: hypothetical protein A2075_01175 [Geobacteraceae bacterium GWC2_58_44]|nr:MAG: hypothetical protein A2075_01175 [Geobacteraceae bacterium GWC2_58_44]HBG04144.1 hypothetical protein [Geobacter sp.]